MERLVAKLKAKMVHPNVVAVLASWLRPRRAHVVVEGQQSSELALANTVFQGTVLGPMLWNLFFEDAREAINDCFFSEVVFADDWNAYRIFPACVPNDTIRANIKTCQDELHR